MRIDLNPFTLSNEIEALNECIGDWVTLASEQLPEHSSLQALGALILEHHDVFTVVLQTYLREPHVTPVQLSLAPSSH
jgi:hypothetical protein